MFVSQEVVGVRSRHGLYDSPSSRVHNSHITGGQTIWSTLRTLPHITLPPPSQKLMNEAGVGPTAELMITALALFVWGCGTGFLRTAPAHSYTGMVSGITAGIVLLGYNKDGPLSRDEYALARVEMTTCGILIWLVVVQCVSLRRAATELHRQASKGLRLLGELERELASLVASPEDEAKMQKAVQLSGRIQEIVGFQGVLSTEAAVEPRLWHADHRNKAAAYVAGTRHHKSRPTFGHHHF